MTQNISYYVSVQPFSNTKFKQQIRYTYANGLTFVRRDNIKKCYPKIVTKTLMQYLSEDRFVPKDVPSMLKLSKLGTGISEK